MNEELFRFAQEMEKKYDDGPTDRFSRGTKAKELAHKSFLMLSELEGLLDPAYMVEGAVKKETRDLLGKSYTIFQKLSDIFGG